MHIQHANAALNRRRRRYRVVSEDCTVIPEYPCERTRLQRSAGGVLLAPPSWLNPVFRGRPRRRLYELLRSVGV